MLTKIKKQKSLVLILLTLTFCIFWMKSSIYLDPDFGYRLRNGQIILEQGINSIRTDPYSYTMPSFKFVEHSWMSTVVIAFVYSIFGVFGVAFLYSVFAVASVFISSFTSKTNDVLIGVSKSIFRNSMWHFGNPVFLLALAIIFGFVGARVQVVSWLMLSVLLFIGLDSKKWSKYRIFIPPLFLFWANLHASFFEGVLVLTIIIISRTFNFSSLLEKRTYKGAGIFYKKIVSIFKRRSFESIDYFILVSSLLLTLVNPYGVGAWRKVLLVAGNRSLRWELDEWMPAVFSFDPALVVFATLSVVFVVKYLRKFDFAAIFIYFFILFQGIASVRHIPLWVIVALPMTTEAISHFYNEIKKKKASELLFKKMFYFTWILAAVVLFMNLTLSTFGAFHLSEASYYPKKAAEVLKRNLPSGEIFSTYGWGGYLSWKLPEKKVFISGLMPAWKNENVMEGELKSAYETYSKIMKGEINYEGIFMKFNVDTVLIPSPERRKDNILFDFLKDKLTKLGVLKPGYVLSEELEADGWIKMYEDKVAVIYRKLR